VAGRKDKERRRRSDESSSPSWGRDPEPSQTILDFNLVLLFLADGILS
jgi:hypothetical protein